MLRSRATHCLSGLNVGRSVCQDVLEDGLEGLEDLLALDARAQLDAQQAGERSRCPLLVAFTCRAAGGGRRTCSVTAVSK